MATNGISNLLIREPSRHIKIEYGHAAMAANENFLVYFAKQILIVIDRDGNVRLMLDTLIDPYDICWSSYLNEFLILGSFGRYALNPVIADRNIQIRKLGDESKSIITCYDKTCLVADGDRLIEEYELPSWTLKRTFSPPQSCKTTQKISRMRFSSNGSHVGLVITERNTERNSDREFNNLFFELRRSNDMTVLQTAHMGAHFSVIAWLSALPNEEFLVNCYQTKKFYLIGSNGQLREEIDYDQNEQLEILSTTLMNERCLVVKTHGTLSELRFYDL